MPETLRRARILAPDLVGLELVGPAAAGPGEVVVRVDSCGLCGSDAGMLAGTHPVIRPPIVPGHEIVGRVGGRRVAVLPQLGCGDCRHCRRDDARLCAQMRLIGGQVPGGVADEVVVPESSLVEVPDAVPDAVVALVEPLAVARHAVGRAPGVAGADVLVVGGGPIGVLVALVARADGADRVRVVEPVAARRGILDHLGVEALEALPDGEVDVAFDCVGGADVPRELLGAVAAGGTLVLVGVAAPALGFDGMLLQRQERTVRGSHMYTRADMTAALALLADGLLPQDDRSLALLFDRRSLDDAPAAFADLAARRSAALKLVIVPALRREGAAS